MTAPELFRIGDDRLLCDHWHARNHTVVLRPCDPRAPVGCDSVRQVLRVLSGRGVSRVLTAALDQRSLEPFTDAGFAPHEDLCVLQHSLDEVAAGPTTCAVRRGSARRDLTAAAGIDAAAFAGSDALDKRGLKAVFAATPSTRFRIAHHTPGRTPVGYAVAGIAGGRGYLQRVAVHPDHRRRGLGRALVLDTLGAFRRNRVHDVLVNTQVANTAARDLYMEVGFVPTDRHLAVWAWDRAGQR